MSPPILAIDPGPTDSGLVLATWEPFQVLYSALLPNVEVRGALCAGACAWMPSAACQIDRLVLERIESMGMPVGASVFDTVFWSGRFVEAWGKAYTLVTRRQVKLHMCGSMRAKDANVRRALLDKLGEPGTKKHPGATYGISGHQWSALALLVTYAETLAHSEAA